MSVNTTEIFPRGHTPHALQHDTTKHGNMHLVKNRAARAVPRVARQDDGKEAVVCTKRQEVSDLLSSVRLPRGSAPSTDARLSLWRGRRSMRSVAQAHTQGAKFDLPNARNPTLHAPTFVSHRVPPASILRGCRRCGSRPTVLRLPFRPNIVAHRRNDES